MDKINIVIKNRLNIKSFSIFVWEWEKIDLFFLIWYCLLCLIVLKIRKLFCGVLNSRFYFLIFKELC